MPKKCKSSGVTTTIVGKELFKRLSGACGGFVAVDEDIASVHLLWARILAKSMGGSCLVFCRLRLDYLLFPSNYGGKYSHG